MGKKKITGGLAETAVVRVIKPPTPGTVDFAEPVKLLGLEGTVLKVWGSPVQHRRLLIKFENIAEALEIGQEFIKLEVPALPGYRGKYEPLPDEPPRKRSTKNFVPENFAKKLEGTEPLPHSQDNNTKRARKPKSKSAQGRTRPRGG